MCDVIKSVPVKHKIMESNAVPSFYFSAYPLKALKLPKEEMQAYIQPSPETIIRVNTNMKILPMIDPYKDKFELPEGSKNQEPEQNADDPNWFNHYE